MDLTAYRATETEKLRTDDLLRLLPRGRRSILEIGSRDGYHTQRLSEVFEAVTALDLEKPDFTIPRVETVRGDVTALRFPDNSFDCVLCAEVLEHVPALERAADEIVRVARHEILIGVPHRQDTRIGRLRCSECGRINPSFGHVNVFDQRALVRLFSKARVAEISYVGERRDRTNAVSAWLTGLAGYPWGTYDQEEPCIHCGSRMRPPGARSLPQKLYSRVAHSIDQLQKPFIRPTGNWIHILFSKQA
jgi:SAM-dependent methyltransferase